MAETLMVFISATSGDLRTVREIVKQGLLTMHCLPIEQANFAPDYRAVAEMLEDRIRGCHAVIHLVGLRYGAEPDPATLPAVAPRRSFTQMEADIARRLGIRLYLFLCPEDFPYDACEPESAEIAALQRAYREEVVKQASLHTRVGDRNDVAQRVRELQLDLEQARKGLASHRRRGVLIAAVFGLVLAGLAGTLWWNIRRTPGEIAKSVRETVQQAATYDPVRVRANLVQQIQQRAEEQIGKLDPVRDWEKIAALESKREQQLGDVDRFLEQLGKAFEQKEASGNYTIASELLASQGVAEALRFLGTKNDSREAKLEVLRRTREVEERAFRELLREKLLTGSLLEKDSQYTEAEKVYRAVVADGGTWAEPRNQLAYLLMRRGKAMEPVEGNRKLREAVELCRGTIVATTRESAPADWATAQTTLALALRGQGERVSGEEGTRLLAEAVVALHAALEVRTREKSPLDWADSEGHLGALLVAQALRADRKEAPQILAEAVAIHRNVLEVRTREKAPEDWAKSQGSLGVALAHLGRLTSGSEGAQFTADAIAAYRSALEVYTRQASLSQWAFIQNALAVALVDQAKKAKGEEALRLFAEVAKVQRSLLGAYSRERSAQDWARVQNNLAITLLEQGRRTTADASRAFFVKSVEASRAALTVYTQDQLPIAWGHASRSLANALTELSKRTEGPEAEPLRAEAAQIQRDLKAP